MRYRTVRRDANHKAIVEALRKVGASVQDLAAVGGGCPDLLVGYERKNFVLEVKRPGVWRKKRGIVQRQTNERQERWRAEWNGSTHIVSSVDEALRAIGVEIESWRNVVQTSYGTFIRQPDAVALVHDG